MNLLQIQGLSVYYGAVEGLRNATLEVKAGTLVTVIGPNGAGKSTLLGALMGVLPSRGVVRFDGKDIGAHSVEQRVQAGLALVPERRELFTEMSVEENLVLGAFARCRRRALLQSDLDEVYARFPRLLERRLQLAGTLSGGERQMVAIGRALMAKPRLLMLDEPSLGLSPLLVLEMFRAITDLRTSGVSILLVEQNARAALQIADHGYVLETGEIAFDGPAEQLLGDRRVVETYLGFRGVRAA